MYECPCIYMKVFTAAMFVSLSGPKLSTGIAKRMRSSTLCTPEAIQLLEATRCIQVMGPMAIISMTIGFTKSGSIWRSKTRVPSPKMSWGPRAKSEDHAQFWCSNGAMVAKHLHKFSCLHHWLEHPSSMRNPGNYPFPTSQHRPQDGRI